MRSERRLLPLAVAAAAIAGLMFGASGIGEKAAGEDQKLLEQAIRRAAVQCYALEGFYPADWQYLQQHYGVVVNQEHTIVHYQFIASNLMPDITVIIQ